MRTRILCLTALIALTLACEKHGELVPPPDGIEAAVAGAVAKRNIKGNVSYKLSGLSVRAYANDAFFVTADVEAAYVESREGYFSKPITWTYIAQKAYQGGQVYWQVEESTKDNMRVLGIKDE
jgi:hypothetical protein